MADLRIHSNEVAGINDSVVGAVDPGSPGIDVTNWGRAQGSTSDRGSDLADVVGKLGRLSTVARLGSNPSGRDTVEILGSNRDTSNQLCELVAVLGDGSLQGVDFVCDASLTT